MTVKQNAKMRKHQKVITSVKGGKKKRVRSTLNEPQLYMPANSKAGVLDAFLRAMDDPDDWKLIPDGDTDENPNGQMRPLSDQELDVIRRVQMQEYADAQYDPYPVFVDFFTGTVLDHPVLEADEPKRRFIPSQWEAKKVARLVKAIRRGLLHIAEDGSVIPKSALDNNSLVEEQSQVYDMWSADGSAGDLSKSVMALHARHIAAPKMALPGHEESYNPPEEYLFEEGSEELVEWEKRKSVAEQEGLLWDPRPNKYKALRLVPAYDRFIHERNSRALDLVYCPRAIRKHITSKADDLLPILPDPRDLRPFPTTRSVDFVGHSSNIGGISVDSQGQLLASISVDGELRVWDVQTGHCSFVRKYESISKDISSSSSSMACSVAWNPNKALCLLAVAINGVVELLVPPGSHGASTRARLAKMTSASSVQSVLSWTVNRLDEKKKKKNVEEEDDSDEEPWVFATIHGVAATSAAGNLSTQINSMMRLTWHVRGDYFCSLSRSQSQRSNSDEGAPQLFVHQLSRQASQQPLQRVAGSETVTDISFHPTKPYLALLGGRSVRLFDLVGRSLVRKLILPFEAAVNASAMAMHSSGDHLLVAAGMDTDGRALLHWFDLDGSSRPYRTLRSHAIHSNIRDVAFHTAVNGAGGSLYPLFASASDDRTVQIVHGQTYADLSAQPMIVPVKTLTGFSTGVSRVQFHPTQPWIFVATSSGDLALYV